MKTVEDYQRNPGWFLDKNNRVGPLTMAYKKGAPTVTPAHYHRTTYEYFLVLDGAATLEVDGTPFRLRRNSFAVVEPGETHSLADPTDDFEVILVMDRYVPDDKVMLGTG